MSIAAGKSQRRIVNFLLQPFIQMRVGVINVCLSLAFVVLLGVYVYVKLVQFIDVVSTLTEADDEVASMLDSYLTSVGVTGAVGAAVFVLISLATSIYMTHRLVGPTVAFRRHIKELASGNYKVKTTLRQGDAFREVADDLNQLSDRLGEAAAH